MGMTPAIAFFGDPRLTERFWSKARVDASGCWLWTASKNPDGYAQYKGALSAVGHREAYLALVGPVPKPLVLDHLCRVRHCVNPAHLEPVPQRINILRGDLPSVNIARSNVDTCRNGLHAWVEENMRINRRTGKRQCAPCLNRANSKRRKRHAEPPALQPGAGEGSLSQGD